MQKKLKILLSVHACSPKFGSEPGMGWNFVNSLSKFHELHVITEEVKWKTDLEAELLKNADLKSNVTFYYIKKTRNKLLRKIWPPSYYFYYKSWQKDAYTMARKLDETENFDIIHQLNMVGFREPGYLWKLNKPFVWGPIGGLEDVDFKLMFNLNFSGFLYYAARGIFNQYQKRFYLRPKQAARRSNSFLIAATPGDKLLIKKLWNKDSDIIPEVGKEVKSSGSIEPRGENEPLKIVWSGQHTPGKALNILLKSLKIMPSEAKWQLSVLGSGEMTKRWKSLAIKYEINEKCNWYAWLDKTKAHRIMKNSHVLCITSLKDLTSTVTLEALSFGLPVICIDHCGFGNVIDERCGIKIPIEYPLKLINNFRDAIATLSFDELYRRELSMGALKRAADFTWEAKVDHLNEIYNSLLKIYDDH